MIFIWNPYECIWNPPNPCPRDPNRSEIEVSAAGLDALELLVRQGGFGLVGEIDRRGTNPYVRVAPVVASQVGADAVLRAVGRARTHEGRSPQLPRRVPGVGGSVGSARPVRGEGRGGGVVEVLREEQGAITCADLNLQRVAEVEV